MRVQLCMVKPFPNPFPPPRVQKGQLGPTFCLSHSHWKIPVQGAVSPWSPVLDSWIQLSLENHPPLHTSAREGARVPHGKGQHFPHPMYFPISLFPPPRGSPPKPSTPHSQFVAIQTQSGTGHPLPSTAKPMEHPEEPAGMQGTQG